MPKYNVIITRDITESVVIEVEATDSNTAEDVALERLGNCDFVDWEIDDGSWNQSNAYVTDVTEVE